jgi:hypothetical protein
MSGACEQARLDEFQGGAPRLPPVAGERPGPGRLWAACGAAGPGLLPVADGAAGPGLLPVADGAAGPGLLPGDGGDRFRTPSPATRETPLLAPVGAGEARHRS